MYLSLYVVLAAANAAIAQLPQVVHEERSAARSQRTSGPLRVHPTNGRYFTDGTRLADGSWKAVYLTGSHTWANLTDRGTSDPPPSFDFDSYLDLLKKHNHNFIRLWGRQVCWYQDYGDKDLHAAPLAWQRAGPGKAIDGKPTFDLTKFDAAYFQRLRSRVVAARDRGIYVSIMFFGGHVETVSNWTGSPFHRDNNANEIDGDANSDSSGSEIETLSEIPELVGTIQKAYVQTVIDTVNDLDNVLYEISNEAGPTSMEWQYDMIRYIRDYERTKPKQHPVGMTAGFWPAEVNRGYLDRSPADWVSYLFELRPAKGQEAFNVNNPFAADGRKVSIQDSDHWWVVPIYGNAAFGRAWVWKSFCRGHNPILMEHLPPRSFVAGDHPLTLDDPGYIAARTSMGQTRRYAERMNLAAMTPGNDIVSTSYCLANPGREYLIYSPDGGTITVDLSAAANEFAVEWFNPVLDKAIRADTIRGGARRKFQVPFIGDAVLYLVASR